MKTFKITLYSIIFLFFFGCKKIEYNKVNEKSKTSEIVNFIDYNIEFPDTVYANSSYDGKINYVSNFDSIIEKFGDKQKNRYVFVTLVGTNQLEEDIVHLKKVVTDTFGAIDNRLIPIYDISFPSKGDYYIDGVINDAVFIDLNRKDVNGENLIRWIEDEVRVTKKVVVIDKEQTITGSHGLQIRDIGIEDIYNRLFLYGFSFLDLYELNINLYSLYLQ